MLFSSNADALQRWMNQILGKRRKLLAVVGVTHPRGYPASVSVKLLKLRPQALKVEFINHISTDSEIQIACDFL